MPIRDGAVDRAPSLFYDSLMMTFLNLLRFIPYLEYPETSRTDDRRSTLAGAGANSTAARSAMPNSRRRLNMSTTLPPEMLERVAAFLPLESLKQVRSADKALGGAAKSVVERVVDHIKVNKAEELVAALAAYKESRITKITLGNGTTLFSGADTFRNEHLALLRDLPLGSVDLSNCRHITGAGLADLPRTVSTVILRGCSKLNDASVLHIPRTASTVDLSGCGRITDRGVENLPRTATTVGLQLCRITDAGVSHLPHGVTTLDLTNCRQITDAGVAQIPVGATRVILDSCNRITPHGIAALRARLAPDSTISHRLPSFELT